MNDDDLKYARYTGMLSAMARFLIDDLVEAVAMLGNEDNYKIKNFKITIEHAERVMTEVGEES